MRSLIDRAKEFLEERWKSAWAYGRNSTARIRKGSGLARAAMWNYIYKLNYRFLVFKERHGGWAITATLLILLAISANFAPTLQGALEVRYSTDKALEGIRALMLNLGGPLIGATAIVSSLVMFSMQVNVERMPHGLFRRLSSDQRLLAAFAVAFLLAICIAGLSITLEKSRLAYVVLVASWGVILILALFLYAFKRALSLVNPIQQLNIVLQTARKEMRAWARRADRVRPLLEKKREPKTDSSPFDSTHDLSRTAYFKLSSQWTQSAQQAIQHAMSFARRYAEQGDYEVSASALNVVVRINAAYVEAKGKTFYTSHAFFENPLTTDGFINNTLEHFRQNAQAAVARRDEQQIEQTLQGMAALIPVYLGIDYASPIASKTHAHLAAGYLSGAVQSVVPHNMADVLMEGVRLMGKSAQLFLAYGKPDDIATLSERIALVACTGTAREDYRPVTMEGMQQLANLTFDLVRTVGKHDIHFPVGELRQDVSLVAKLFLALPDTPLTNIHSAFLGPYYSSTSLQALLNRLKLLANALSEAKAGNDNAQTVIRNIEQWADGMYEAEKELLLTAIKARSHFTFDMIHWITGITEILLVVSNAPACQPHYKAKLQKHARWLIAVLTWIPDDKDTVTFIENFQMTETLFEAAFDSHNRDCDELANDLGGYLVSWTFKGGKHSTGWGILDRGLSGSAIFALARGDAHANTLKADISSRLAKDGAPTQEIRDRAARGLREQAATLYRQGHMISRIQMAIEQADRAKLKALLEEIANLLSPGTAHEPVNPGIY